MKKSILTVAVAALALAGCTKNETVDVADSNVIGFANAFVGNPTKAVTDVTTQSIDKFFVYGSYAATEDAVSATSVFTNTEVTKTENAWTYANQQQWVNNQYYKFAAYYAPASLTSTNLSFDFKTGHLTLTDFEVKADGSQGDLLYAEQIQESGAENTVRPKVEFTFSHILSKVKFTLKSGFAKGVTVTVSNFKFFGMDTKATYNGTDWAEATEPISSAENGYALYTAENVVKVAKIDEDGTSVNAEDVCLVMPQTVEENTIKATFTVTLEGTGIPEDADTKDITAIIPTGSWDEGYCYNYEATIDGQTMDYIEFTVKEVSTWTDADINMVNDKTTSGQLVGE